MELTIKDCLRPPEDSPFSNKKLLLLYIPIITEQFMVAALGMADAWLASGLNDAASAGVSHSFIIANLCTQLINGLAAGGSVMAAQWYGSRENDRASDAARSSLLFTVSVGLLCCLLLVLFPYKIISLMVGDVGTEVLNYAADYLIPSALVLPFSAVLFVCTATYRAQGNTRIPMMSSIIMMTISLSCKFVFTRVLGLGVSGMGLATLAGNSVVAIALLSLMKTGKADVSFRVTNHPFFEPQLMKKIISIALPTGIESATFQLGLLLVQRIIASYGVIQTAAHGIASRLQPLSYLPGQCWGIVSMIVAGQCCGAQKHELAKKCTIHITLLSYVWTIVINIPLIFAMNRIVSLFGGSEETLKLASKLMILYCCCAVPLYAPAFGLPQALRGTGDVKYTMRVVMTTMFAVRIGVAYILGTVFALGAFGVWIAMIIDWAVRSFAFTKRFSSNKWMQNRVI